MEEKNLENKIEVEMKIQDKNGYMKKAEKNLLKEIRRKALSYGELNAVIDQIKNPPIKGGVSKHYWAKRHCKIGLCGDLHIGSKYADYETLSDIFKRFKKENVNAIYMAGDITEGYNMRPGHSFECNMHGADAQINEVVKRVPNINKPIYFITGDHDYSHYKRQGVDVGKHIEEQRKDMHYLGMFDADIMLAKKTKLRLVHPAKGTAYALCVDDKTEILTEGGWKLFKDLRGEWVATLNPKTLFFEWQKPSRKIVMDFDGEMLNFKARSFDLMVTPNHKLFVRRYRRNIRDKPYMYPKKAHGFLNYDWNLIEAEEIGKARLKQTWQMIRHSVGFRHPKLPKVNDDLIRLYAWYVTEGCGHKNGKQAIITQCKVTNPENYDEILGILNNLKIKYGCYGKNKKDITISNKRLTTELTKAFGRTSKEKKLPFWIKNLPREQLRLFLETMIKGDGWKNGKSWGYKSISQQLLDDVQEIAIKCGYGATKGKESVSISSIQNYPTINNKPKKVKYKGKVYCVTVPNHLILVRKNGKAVWTGNSYHPQKMIEAFAGGQKPNILAIGHYHKVEYLFYRNIHCFQTGCLQSQSAWMKRMSLAAMKGAWIVDVYMKKNGTIDRLRMELLPYYK